MEIRHVIDSKGAPHYVLMQEHPTTCGPACAAMVEEIYKSQSLLDPEGRARAMSKLFPRGWTPDLGTAASNIASVLLAEGVTAACRYQANPVIFLPALVQEKKPVIVHIQWRSGGGHFVVCKKIYPDGTMIFLDPVSGLVEVPIGNAPAYKTGDMSGWIIFTGH